MPGLGRKRRQKARRRQQAGGRQRKLTQPRPALRAAGREAFKGRTPVQTAVGMVTAVPRAGLDIVTDAAQRTKQLLTPSE